jgi:DNA-binding transcriptional MocR family regulator
MLDIAFTPDRSNREPIYAQLAHYLRSLIASGRLRAGEKVPATRELASALGIGRNTAAQAYQSLIDDGSLLAHVGQGTFVSSRGAAAVLLDSEPESPRAFDWEHLFSKAARQPLPAGFAHEDASKIRFDFRCGRVDLSVLPGGALRRAYSKVLKESLPEIANIAHPFGYQALREQIASTLISRGIECVADDVLVTAGAQQAIDLVARVLVDPGDHVAIEAPGYTIAALALRSAGANLIPIEVDEEGMRTDQLARALRTHKLKAIYTTPAAQMPTGVVLSERRRRALLELADETQTPILEDDYDSEFRYGPSAPAALKTWDRAGQVIYVGTFSKALFPGMRIGYTVAAHALRDRLAVAQVHNTFGADLLSQAAIAELLASGAFERHVRKLRRHYTERRGELLRSLARSMPKGTRWTEPCGGLQVWLTLPPDVSGGALQRLCRSRGLVYTPGISCYLASRGGESQLALSFANQSPEAIDKGIRLLARSISELAPSQARGARRPATLTAQKRGGI